VAAVRVEGDAGDVARRGVAGINNDDVLFAEFDAVAVFPAGGVRLQGGLRGGVFVAVDAAIGAGAAVAVFAGKEADGVVFAAFAQEVAEGFDAAGKEAAGAEFVVRRVVFVEVGEDLYAAKVDAVADGLVAVRDVDALL